MSSGGKGGASQTTGYKYSMDVHMGLFRGPVNVLRQIRVGDRTAWKGELSTNQTFNIDEPDLFGGDTSEGGIQGKIYLMLGAQDQVADAYVKDQIGQGQPCPDFRGLSMLYYTGQVSANNPYPKTWKMRCGRSTAGWDNDDPWYPEKALLELLPDTDNTADDPTLIHAMNGVHMIYECLTNRAWGKGWPRSLLDDAGFKKAADTLYAEQFGLCLKWNRQDNISEIIKTINDHIGAGIFIDRGTGLITINLIRQDYDPNDLPVFNYDSGLLDIQNDSGAAPTTSINELIIRYTNPEKDEVAEARVHSLAGVQTSGRATSTVEYLGLPTFALATRVGQRDLRTFAFGLKRYTVVMDRRAWRLAPTKVFRLQDLQRGLENIVLRVADMEDKLDDGGDGTITINAIQDVFGLPATSFVKQQPPTWVPPSGDPVPVVYQDATEASYRDLVMILTRAELSAVSSDQGTIATVATRPTSMSQYYNLWSKTGAESYVQRSVSDWTPSAALAATIGPYDTALTLTSLTDIDDTSVVEGQALYIGSEIMKVVTRVDTAVTVERGCADTLPQGHAASARVWFYDRYLGSDGREYVSGETVNAKLQTHTSTANQDLATAAELTVLMARRQYRAYPPGNLTLNGVLAYNVTSVRGDIVFTWAHRDRVSQSDVLIGHTVGSIGPEVGTTYTLRFYNGVTLLRTSAGITAATFTYDYTMAEADGWVPSLTWELESARSGYASSQKYHSTVSHVPLGPFRPVIDVSLTGDVGSTNPFVFGSADPASSVQLYLGVYPGGVANGSPVVADGGGNWSKSMTGLVAGGNNIYAIATDGFGSSPPSLPRTPNVVWYGPDLSLEIDFKNNRFRKNGVNTINATDTDWTGLFDVAKTSTAQFLVKPSDGSLVYCAVNHIPYISGVGFIEHVARTNRNTNFNVNPTATTNVVKSGDAAATLTTPADATALSTGLFADASLVGNLNGNCFRLDDTTGTAEAKALIGGAAASTATHCFTVYVRGDAGRIETNDVTPVVLATFLASAAYQRVSIAFNPTGTTIQVGLVVGAGKAINWWGNQYELGAYPTSITPVAGAAAARAATNLRHTLGTEFNAPEGILTASAAVTVGVTVTTSDIVRLLQADANNGNMLQWLTTATVRGRTVVASVDQAAPATGHTSGAMDQVVYGWKVNDFVLAKNGGTPATDASGTVPSGTPAILMLGTDGTNGTSGIIERIGIGKVKQSNAAIQRRSGWVLLP